MATTSTEATGNATAPEAIPVGINTLKIPTWFIAIVLVLLSLRVYAKLTQMAAPPGQGVAWITLEQYNKMPRSSADGKDLVLYEFTADWCPPCQKRERTTFRSPKIINEINSNYVPVRIDLTTRADGEKEDVKQLVEKFDVYSIPRCVITLRSGEHVSDDHYLFATEFDDFLTGAKKGAAKVHAELALAKGDCAGAIAKLSPEMLQGQSMYGLYGEPDYLMCHHLLTVLNRQKEAESLMKQTLDLTRKSGQLTSDSPPAAKSLEELNSYLRGETTDEKLLAGAHYNSEKAGDYLAIGLKSLREGNKEKALKALHQSSLFSAKSYQSDQLAEFLIKELEH